MAVYCFIGIILCLYNFLTDCLMSLLPLRCSSHLYFVLNSFFCTLALCCFSCNDRESVALILIVDFIHYSTFVCSSKEQVYK